MDYNKRREIQPYILPVIRVAFAVMLVVLAWNSYQKWPEFDLRQKITIGVALLAVFAMNIASWLVSTKPKALSNNEIAGMKERDEHYRRLNLRFQGYAYILLGGGGGLFLFLSIGLRLQIWLWHILFIGSSLACLGVVLIKMSNKRP